MHGEYLCRSHQRRYDLSRYDLTAQEHGRLTRIMSSCTAAIRGGLSTPPVHVCCPSAQFACDSLGLCQAYSYRLLLLSPLNDLEQHVLTSRHKQTPLECRNHLGCQRPVPEPWPHSVCVGRTSANVQQYTDEPV